MFCKNQTVVLWPCSDGNNVWPIDIVSSLCANSFLVFISLLLIPASSRSLAGRLRGLCSDISDCSELGSGPVKRVCLHPVLFTVARANESRSHQVIRIIRPVSTMTCVRMHKLLSHDALNQQPPIGRRHPGDFKPAHILAGVGRVAPPECRIRIPRLSGEGRMRRDRPRRRSARYAAPGKSWLRLPGRVRHDKEREMEVGGGRRNHERRRKR